jgi:hypothetical protein
MPLSALPGVFAAFLAEDLRPRSKEIWMQQDMSVASAALGFVATVVGTDEPPATQRRPLADEAVAHGEEPG